MLGVEMKRSSCGVSMSISCRSLGTGKTSAIEGGREALRFLVDELTDADVRLWLTFRGAGEL